MSTATKFSGLAAAAFLAACTYFGVTAPAKATNLAFTGHLVTDNEVDTDIRTHCRHLQANYEILRWRSAV
jgi:hypothetical protein